MATSGSIDFSVSRDDIITEALEQLGVLEAGDTATSDDVTSCARTLNMMIKSWQTDGLNVFSVKRGYLFLELDKTEYTLGPSGDRYVYSFTKQTIDGAASSGAGTVDLTSASDFTDGDTIGIYQSDNTMLWTTGTKSGNTITLGSNLTADVNDDATVYFYTSRADAPAAIIEAAHRSDSLNERPIDMVSRKSWSELSTKTTDGSAVQAFFEDKVDSPVLHVWQRTTDPRDILVLWVKRTREDFDAAGNTPDFPQHWFLPLALNLAVLVAPKFGVSAINPNFSAIRASAKEWYEKAQDYDSSPEENIYLEIDR